MSDLTEDEIVAIAEAILARVHEFSPDEAVQALLFAVEAERRLCGDI